MKCPRCSNFGAEAYPPLPGDSALLLVCKHCNNEWEWSQPIRLNGWAIAAGLVVVGGWIAFAAFVWGAA